MVEPGRHPCLFAAMEYVLQVGQVPHCILEPCPFLGIYILPGAHRPHYPSEENLSHFIFFSSFTLALGI